MTDNLHNCGHITHQMKIICTFEVFSASCIRLFDRLSVIGVFNHFSCSKKPCNRTRLQGLNVLDEALIARRSRQRAVRAELTLMGEVRWRREW